ncbi:MAG: N-acyl-D-amino acid deacylase [Planctomycetaceae bacterium]|nr:N-acyl-D-amino acid deacylase [Planctomycetaceae bacterium]
MLVATTLYCLACIAADPIDADLVIRHARIYDGSGRDAFPGDIALRGKRIVAIGHFSVRGEPQQLDGTGLIAAPGFIDLHSHSDRSILQPATRQNANYLKQGVTSVVTGNCGGGAHNVAALLGAVDQHGTGTNVLPLLPHGALRREVMGTANRAPTPGELAELMERVEQGMRAGAWGISTGLIYIPGTFANQEELIALAQVVARHGGLYASHMRNENTRLLESIQETLAIGQRAGLPVHISHFKASGRQSWGLAADAIALIRQARDAGQTVTADQYPYTASSTSLSVLAVPRPYRHRARLISALQDPAEAVKLRQGIAAELKPRNRGADLLVADYAANRSWQGKNLVQLAEQEESTAVEIVLQMERNGGAQMVSFSINEAEIRLIMQQPFVATASDGGAQQLDADTRPHPRNYGCFPRKIGRYALRGQTVTVAQAIRSCSGLAADILGLTDRGYLRPGQWADLVLLDPNTYIDTATYQAPHQYATGVRYLFVNGTLAIAKGRLTGVLAGRGLRHRVAPR